VTDRERERGGGLVCVRLCGAKTETPARRPLTPALRPAPPTATATTTTAPAILWVGFNIFGPLTNQLGRMGEMKEDAEEATVAPSRKRR